jgi:hypothetical protein
METSSIYVRSKAKSRQIGQIRITWTRVSDHATVCQMAGRGSSPALSDSWITEEAA